MGYRNTAAKSDDMVSSTPHEPVELSCSR